MRLEDLSKDELLKLIRAHAKNWLAHDGCWFLAVEDKYGIETAIELDARSWERFAPIEAERIMESFDMPRNGGLDMLYQALQYRQYAMINTQHTWRINEKTMRHQMVECRVQRTRQRKGLAPFPCKSVGLIEYSQFACTIDPRIETTCVHCPPDAVTDSFCEWEFRLKES